MEQIYLDRLGFLITFFEIAHIHTETAEADEETAQTAYDKLTQENAVTKTTKQGDVKGKTNEVKQLEVALGNYKENKATTTRELDAVLTYLDKLKPQCETKVGLERPSFGVLQLGKSTFSCSTCDFSCCCVRERRKRYLEA